METLIINVPEKKSTLIKLLLKELGVTIQNKTKAKLLAEEINKASSNKKPSDFFGILSPEEGKKFEKHVQQIRGEWDRNI